MSLPQVVNENPQAISAAVLAQYQASVERTLYDAQSDRLQVDLVAYRETLLMASINDAARQNLPQFARLPMLIHWGAFLNTPRLPAQKARTTLRFAHSILIATPTVIPVGFRVVSENETVFVTAFEVVIPAGLSSVEVLAYAELTGPDANGLPQDSITRGFDELPTGVTVTNISVTSGGADDEDIERFRSRIMLAMNRPSAGSERAFILTALSADVRVIDASVQMVTPGRLRLTVLTDADPVEIVAKVDRAVQKPDVKPLTDTIDTVAAVAVFVNATILLTPRKNAVVSDLQPQAQAILQGLSNKLKRTLGYDSVASQISEPLQALAGIKRVLITGADAPIGLGQYAVLSYTLSFAEAEDD